MAKDPAFLFYYQDFLVGTTFMTLEERGAYITLLCHLADKGGLSEGNILKTISSPIWEAICCKFKKENGLFYNERLRAEVAKRQKFTESRRKNLHKEPHMAPHMVPHMENVNENEKEDISGKEDISEKYPYLSDREFGDAFNNFLDMRKAIKSKATKRGQELILKKLHNETILTAIKMLEQSTMNSWKSVFPLKEEGKHTKAQRKTIQSMQDLGD